MCDGKLTQNNLKLNKNIACHISYEMHVQKINPGFIDPITSFGNVFFQSCNRKPLGKHEIIYVKPYSIRIDTHLYFD